MERQKCGKERLILPTDFILPAGSRNVQKELVPPSHFTKSPQLPGPSGVVPIPEISQPLSWRSLGLTSVPSVDLSSANPWLTISQFQQEILELRKENQRIKMLQGGRIPGDHPSDQRARCPETHQQWSRQESLRCLETEKHNAEVERLKGQVEALTDTAERYREEMRNKDSTMKRQSCELEALHEELYKAKTELIQVREEFTHTSAQKEKISLQLERLKGESAEEITKLRRDVERSKEEAREISLKVETDKMQTEEEARQNSLRLSQQLEEIQKKQEGELHQLIASHLTDLVAARKTNNELEDGLQSMTSEVLQLKSTLIKVSTERDGLREHLSQMEQAFETQSATLHSLRNYIGQLVPENTERDKLNNAVERLTKDKATLQTTIELLTIRLNSANEILALQEEKMVKKTSTDPLMMNRCEGLQVLQLWREKVFKLCVQLRTKDIELKGETDQLLSKVSSTEQQLQHEHHRASVLQHNLDDRIAELDLERVKKETLKQDFFQTLGLNSQLKSQNRKADSELKTLTEAVQRFSLAFQSKVIEVDAAQTRLLTLSQRITFAQGRVETIQGLIMRRCALQKVQQSSKQLEEEAVGTAKLQTELSLVCEERDKLREELKRTPELIDKTLSDLQEQYESKLRLQQQLEQSRVEVCQALAGREEAEQRLHQVRAQLEESDVNVEELRTELLSQQESTERALQEKVSEIEDQCAEKLREMEIQVNTAKREHTKAVMTLRHFEREAARKRNETREHLRREHPNKEDQNKQSKENEKDKNLLLATMAERGPIREYSSVHTASLQNSAAPQETPSDWSRNIRAKVQLPKDDRLLSVLEELHALSSAVVNSSDDSAEEEEKLHIDTRDHR